MKSVLLFTQFLCVVFARSIDNARPDTDAQPYTLYAEVTYPGIGHFTTSDFWDPIYRPIVFLPQSPEKMNVKFLLHTRKNLNNAQTLKVSQRETIKNSFFDGNKPTKFLVHGFLDNQLFGQWMRDMKDEFLMAGDYNVVIVDWSGGNGLPYGQATANTRVVGPVIGMMIQDLVEVTGLKLDQVHILGHSLGSHVAGYAGQFLKGAVGRITGLDPAGPYFEGLKWPEAKLDPTDAIFVDAIHTDARHLIPDLGFGMYETSGHLDFYPNGGRDQPGCDQQRWTSIITDGLLEGARRLVACNHQRAVDFYMTSINHQYTKGVSYQCADYDSFLNGKCTECGDGSTCAVLGEDAAAEKPFEKKTRGTRFFLSTTETHPYFKHQYEIKVKLADPTDKRISNHGTIYVTLNGAKAEEKFNLNEKDQIFRLGETYTFIKDLESDLGDLNSVTVRWHRTLGGIIKQQMWIDSVTVVPLSSENVLNREKHLAEIKTFCGKTRDDGIPNEKDYEFDVICK